MVYRKLAVNVLLVAATVCLIQVLYRAIFNDGELVNSNYFQTSLLLTTLASIVHYNGDRKTKTH
jgi:hypothetical protein